MLDQNLKPRLVVPLATAVMLTYSGTWMLAFDGRQTILDSALNYFAMIVGPLLALHEVLTRRLSGQFLMSLVPAALLMSWVGLYYGTSMTTDETVRWALAMFAAFMLACQIRESELPRLRMCVLAVTALASVVMLVMATDVLQMITSGWMRGRLGTHLVGTNSAAGVSGVLLPRIMYVLIFTSIATIIIDKRLIVRAIAAGLTIVPAIIAFSSGGRGALVAFGAACIVFLLMQRSVKTTIISLIVLLAMTVVGWYVIEAYFPILRERLESASAEARMRNWVAAAQDISLFGRGAKYYGVYAHNLFLELLQDYGIVGFFLLCAFLYQVWSRIWRAYKATRSQEILWVMGLMTLQFTAQQFSLNIHHAMLWATLALPLGVCVARSYEPSEQMLYGAVEPVRGWE